MSPTENIERRRNWRFIKGLVIGQVVTLAIATAAGAVALVGLSNEVVDKTNAINQSRQGARYDNCFLLRSVVFTAAGPTGEGRAQAFIDRSELSNCVTYALHPVEKTVPPSDKGR